MKEHDPLMKECTRCGTEKLHNARSNGKPCSYCPDCMKKYAKEHRKKNWQTAKARNTWKGVLARCLDPRQGLGCAPSVPRYADYGAKGVKVSKRWQGQDGFRKFLLDVGLPPHPSFTLDRKNPRHGYTPRNCVWVNVETQQTNRKNTVWIEALNPATGKREVHCLGGWEKITGISRNTVSHRICRLGWDPERAVSQKTPRMLARECPF